MDYSGRCSCGAIQYRLSGEPRSVSLCHCEDCRRSSGAPVMAWVEYPEDALSVTRGEPKTINSSGSSMRSFCPDCSTGLFYRNEAILPGLVEVQLATLDNADTLPPTVQIQTAERLGWMPTIHSLPEFDRFPE
jgi:hypothetical protein